jgi:hypothetical protein
MFMRVFSERKNPWFRKVLGAALSLAVAALVFTGCAQSTGSDDDLLADLKGSWVSGWGEEYIISNTEFISAYAGATSYKGPIVNIRRDGSGTGYITIRYTENSYSPDAVGNYYVIRWENLIANVSIKIAGAFNDMVEGKGYGTVAEAETGYTGTIGGSLSSFAISSDCYFTAVESQASAIAGSWASSLDSYTITDKVVIYSISYQAMCLGEIVNIRNLEGDTNYITFKYITSDTDNDLVGKYCVLYWKDFSGTPASVKIATAYSSLAPGDEGKDTQAEAEGEYTIDNVADYFSDLKTFTPPSY